MIERGGWPTQVPISVAQVSAAEAARLPAPAAINVSIGSTPAAVSTAATVNGKPLDITCQASRGPGFATTPAVLADFRPRPARDSNVDVTK